MTDHTPNAILHGGPAEHMPHHERIRTVGDPTQTKIKVLVGNRYEHFVADGVAGTHEDGDLRVFRWAGTTYVAE